MRKTTLQSIGILLLFSGYVCGEEIKPGEYKSGYIAEGEVDSFTFHANAGDVVSILMGEVNDVNPNSSFWPQVELIEPNGVRTPDSGEVSARINAKRIGQSGTHMIIASDRWGDRACAYGLSMVKNPGPDVNDPEDDPVPILPGEYKEGYIASGDLDAYSFHANAGDVVSILMGEVNDVNPNSSFWPQVELIEPNGVRTPDSGEVSARINAKRIGQSGTHMIIASDRWGHRVCRYRLSMARLFVALGTPTISSLSDEPDPVFQGGTLTLTASGVNDLDGRIVQVDFYRDLNGNGYLDRDGPDQLLGSDTNGPDGWKWSGSIGRLPPVGLNMYFAVAKDNDGLWSDPASTTGKVVPPIPGDINLDGQVNCDDIDLLMRQWGASGCNEPSWCNGADLDQNGIVDADDLQIIGDHWVRTLE